MWITRGRPSGSAQIVKRPRGPSAVRRAPRPARRASATGGTAAARSGALLVHGQGLGHGLEGDFNRKGTSAFSGRIGERVAAPGVTVVDDGAMNQRRGSLTIDDEGTPTGRTTLIEDGILIFWPPSVTVVMQAMTWNG